MDKKDKSLYYKAIEHRYKDAIFEAGLVKNSPHKCDTIYIRIKDMVLHLRRDEVYAVIACLSETLWIESMAKLNKYKDFVFKKRRWR